MNSYIVKHNDLSGFKGWRKELTHVAGERCRVSCSSHGHHGANAVQQTSLLMGVGLVAFAALVVAPAVTAYRRPLHRAAAVVLSLYVLAALVGVCVALGAVIVIEWPRIF